MYKFLKNLGARRVACSKFSAVDRKVLGATVGNFVATVTWPAREFLRPWSTCIQYILQNVTNDHKNSCSV